MKSGSHREPRVSQAVDGASPPPATPEERLARLEAMVADLHELFFGQERRPADREEKEIARRMAVRACLRGDRRPLDLFCRKYMGGKSC